jgi:hypothetical protein
VPRLLWFSVYLSLCFVAFKGMKYFSELLPTPKSLAHQHRRPGVPLQSFDLSLTGNNPNYIAVIVPSPMLLCLLLAEE